MIQKLRSFMEEKVDPMEEGNQREPEARKEEEGGEKEVERPLKKCSRLGEQAIPSELVKDS